MRVYRQVKNVEYRDGIKIKGRQDQDVSVLPAYKPVSFSNNRSTWHDITGEDICRSLDDAYREVVHWIPNHFMLPSGNCGKQFILCILLRSISPSLVWVCDVPGYEAINSAT